MASDDPSRRGSPVGDAHGGNALWIDGRALTWDDLGRRVSAAVESLEARGLVGERPLGLLGDLKLDTLVWIHALIHCGTPMVLLHPRTTADEHRRFLADCRVETVLDGPAPFGDGAAVATLDPLNPARPIDPERPLAILRTSGSSGRPKGVVLSRRAFFAAARASADNLGWRPDDRWLLSLPVAHVGGLSILVRCLLGRRPAVVEPLERFDPLRVAELIDARRITLLSVVPTMLRRLLDLPSWRPPVHLRAILLGGAAAPKALLERAADRRWPVLTTYGSTETCSQVATQRPGTVNRGQLGSGSPLSGWSVRIREGVVEVRGDALMSGYLVDGSLARPFTADGFFPTQDLGHLDAHGHLHILGRRDAVIISGGENVHPTEVEAVLEHHPAIAEAAVHGVDDPEWGQRVVASIVLEADADPSIDLTDGFTEHLAPHQRPREIRFVESLPRNRLGKLDRRALAASWDSKTV